MGLWTKLFGGTEAPKQESHKQAETLSNNTENKEAFVETNADVLAKAIAENLFDTGKLSNVEGGRKEKLAKGVQIGNEAISALREVSGEEDWESMDANEFNASTKGLLVINALSALETRQTTDANTEKEDTIETEAAKESAYKEAA